MTGRTLHVSGAIQPGNVAFHAKFSADQCVSVGHVLTYDEVHVNVGNGYKSYDGIFVAPVSGVYVFSVTLVSVEFYYMSAALLVNGVEKATIVSDKADYLQASSTIVAQVQIGEHVFVRVSGESNCKLSSNSIHGTSSFSGWLLFEL